MENQVIFEMDVDGTILSAKITNEDALELLFSNGDKIVFVASHEQDCCEQIYADWSNIDVDKLVDASKHYCKIIIKGVEGIGLLLVFDFGEIVPIKGFVPCYSIQNGCYFNDLLLAIFKNNKELVVIDIEKFEEQQYGY